MTLSRDASRKYFAPFALALLIFNIPVILWGAYVRISFSGDGCGAHWPFCNGYVIPQNMAKPMAIEFLHRVMTGADSVGAILLCVWAFYAFGKGHAVRRYASWSLFFLFVEALLGAGLVLFRKVAHDQSAGRVVYLSAHLTNTMLLLGALAMTAWLARHQVVRMKWVHISKISWYALAVTILVSITGTIAALGDMLFPATSLAAGWQQDFAANSHFLLRLRLFHPAIALCGAAFILWTSIAALRRGEHTAARKAGVRVLTLLLIQIAAGTLNIALLAPVWTQLLHLLIADLLWIAMVAMVLELAEIRPPFSQSDSQVLSQHPADVYGGLTQRV
jgi:heme a synthase